LTNEVFHWDPIEDKFVYSGKSYILERLSSQIGAGKGEMKEELSRRTELLSWMHGNRIRAFKDVAGLVASYTESSDELMEKVRKGITGFEISNVSKIDDQNKLREPNESNENPVKDNVEKISVFLIKKKRRNIKILEGNQCL